MLFYPPEKTNFPKNKKVKVLEVLLQTHKKIEVKFADNNWPWVIARLEYDDKECLGIRYLFSPTRGEVGYPNGRGYPHWFIIPNVMKQYVLNFIKDNKNKLEEYGD